MNLMTRNDFLLKTFATGMLVGGAGRVFGSDASQLRLGVISDIHVTTPESTERFVRALAYFRDRRADAVIVSGDLSDWGLRSGFRYVADAWRSVFPDDRAPDGRKVVKLFCTGNHDYDGYAYGDMTLDMHAQGYSEDDALVRYGMARCWEEAFREPWAPIRHCRVKGYDFIVADWKGYRDLGKWMAGNASKIDTDKPFFYIQHPPLKGTTLNTVDDCDDGIGKSVLSAFPNAVAFSGHYHLTLNDERSVWQDCFTSITVPSMSYTAVPGGYENGSHRRNGTAPQSMRCIDARFEETEAQGYFVTVEPDRMVVERRDFEACCEAASPWMLPLPARTGGVFSPMVRKMTVPIPEFPTGATLKLRFRNGSTRNDRWQIAVVCEVPAAKAADGGRVFDYELRVVPSDGSAPLVKKFLSPAFHKLPKDEPLKPVFHFNAAELPQDRDYWIEIRPRNSFGIAGKPLRSKVMHGRPGLDSYTKIATKN